jgi:SMP-30/Gluconolactonase/LRE-like region
VWSRCLHTDGRVVTLADRWQGKRLNSPNDLVVKSDGSIWFTDPSYGIDWEYEGERAESEIGACHVYRIDPASGEVAVVADDFEKPNGIAFSPDESRLYVADTGISRREDGPRHIRVFDVAADGRTLRGGEVFAACEVGVFDGFRVDTEGRLRTSTAEGVHCYLPSGDLIGKLRVPEVVANCTFGGPKKKPAVHLRHHLPLRHLRQRQRRAEAIGAGSGGSETDYPAMQLDIWISPQLCRDICQDNLRLINITSDRIECSAIAFACFDQRRQCISETICDQYRTSGPDRRGAEFFRNRVLSVIDAFNPVR